MKIHELSLQHKVHILYSLHPKPRRPTYSQEVGLSDAEKQASVLAMGHSLETKRKHYDLREKIKIMQPALDFTQRIVEKELRSFDRSKLVEGMIDLDDDDEEDDEK
jgi:hypothetical protein